MFVVLCFILVAMLPICTYLFIEGLIENQLPQTELARMFRETTFKTE